MKPLLSTCTIICHITRNFQQAYPSMKPLSAWVVDLVCRLDTIRAWIEKGTPAVFWISGFYFPQVRRAVLAQITVGHQHDNKYSSTRRLCSRISEKTLHRNLYPGRSNQRLQEHRKSDTIRSATRRKARAVQ